LTSNLLFSGTSVPVKWHLIPSKQGARMCQGDGRQATDSRTDHATEKYVAIGGIARAARGSIPPNNGSANMSCGFCYDLLYRSQEDTPRDSRELQRQICD